MTMTLSRNDKNIISNLTQNEMIQLESQILRTISIILQTGIKDLNKYAINQKVSSINQTFFDASFSPIIFKISFKFLRPNLIIDEQRTQEIIDQQMTSIQPFSTRFKSGQIIISKGEIFNEFHIDTLKPQLYRAKIQP